MFSRAYNACDTVVTGVYVTTGIVAFPFVYTAHRAVDTASDATATVTAHVAGTEA